MRELGNVNEILNFQKTEVDKLIQNLFNEDKAEIVEPKEEAGEKTREEVLVGVKRKRTGEGNMVKVCT